MKRLERGQLSCQQNNNPPSHPMGFYTSDRTTPPNRQYRRPSAHHTMGLRASPWPALGAVYS